VLQEKVLDLDGIPVLPRSENAPAFGEDIGFDEKLAEEEPMSPEEYRQYLNGTLLNVRNMRPVAGSDGKDFGDDDFGGITKFVEKEDKPKKGDDDI